jgi:D-3-phosphoglycerate dehydrogenase
MRQKPKVLLTKKISDAPLADLARHFDVVIAPDVRFETLRRLAADAHAVVVRDYLPPDICEHAPHLIAIVRHGVGLDLIPVDACTRHGIAVSNVPGGNANSVAEYCVGAMLVLARSLHLADAAQRQIGWEPSRQMFGKGMELHGRCAAIIGCGAIGSRIAHMLHLGMGMRVIVATRNAAAVPAFAEQVGIDEACAQADFLLPCVPANDETRHMIDARRIAIMKPAAFLINAARGEIIDESALIAALRDKRIAGAALDVLEGKAPAADHPLHALDNVLLTPHIAGRSADANLRNGLQVVADLRAIFNGRHPGHLINPGAWPRVMERLLTFQRCAS